MDSKKKTMRKVLMFFAIASLLIWVPYGNASVQVQLFDQTYVRGKSLPTSVKATFPSTDGQALIEVYNGDNDPTTRENSAVITLNNKIIFFQSMFSNKIRYLKKTIDLSQGQNNLTVLLTGKPGSKIRINISQNYKNLTDGEITYIENDPLSKAIIQYPTVDGDFPVEVSSGRIFVFFKTAVPFNISSGLIRQKGGEIIKYLPSLNYFVVKVLPGTEISYVNLLRNEPIVDFADVDFALTGATYTSSPSEGVEERRYLNQINAYSAWGSLSNKTVKREIKIGIIDEGYKGLELNPNDFAGRLSWDSQAYPGLIEHGTIVSSVAAAKGDTDNLCIKVEDEATGEVSECSNIGINWHSKIFLTNNIPDIDIITNVLNSSIPFSTVFDNLIKMVINEAKVINISLGGNIGFFHRSDGLCNFGEITSQQILIGYLSKVIVLMKNSSGLDFLVVLAAGNEGCDLGSIQKQTIY